MKRLFLLAIIIVLAGASTFAQSSSGKQHKHHKHHKHHTHMVKKN
ncbi:MAG: hypothetical protein ABI416_16310 [Ginsengibacter sp.]